MQAAPDQSGPGPGRGGAGAAGDETEQSSPGSDGELERIRRQLGRGGGEGREQQRSAERNVLMGRRLNAGQDPPFPRLLKSPGPLQAL